ncbi:MAG: glycosylphosphatidylinositol anchor biosynthesis [Watsoniomyces obsoletus]|nr:MAG: glycosylphosphatidylinositol anchor biosynthesis [Watsoniomyces obsoletus]
MATGDPPGPGMPMANQGPGFIFNSNINLNVNLGTSPNTPQQQPSFSSGPPPYTVNGPHRATGAFMASGQGHLQLTPMTPFTVGGMGNMGANAQALVALSTPSANTLGLPTLATSIRPSTRPKRARRTYAAKKPRKSFQNISTPDDDAASVDTSTTSGTGNKRRQGGESVKKPRKRYRAKGPTRLRKGRDVITEVPMDVWELVMSYCPPEFLGRARRINKNFHHALQYESAWRRNRLQLYGPEMPGPLPGMKEDEYSNLLHGLGCMDCGTPKTRRTYWLWRKRWCNACFTRNTIREGDVGPLVNHAVGILETVPYGWVDAWDHYVSVTFPELHPFRQNNTRKRVYGRADLARLLTEYEELKKNHTGEEGVDFARVEAWTTEKREARIELSNHVERIEKWQEARQKQKHDENTDLKQQRIDFFGERAKQLDPPLNLEELGLISAYKRAVQVTRPPTERAWRMLLPKLREESEAAQKSVAESRRKARIVERERLKYLQRQSRRSDGHTAEQQLLRYLTKEVMTDLDFAQPAVADADYPLLGLDTIRRKYYEMAQAYEAEHGRPVTYRLLLEDARWLFATVIVDHMGNWSTTRSLAAKKFKCPGCTRHDMHKRHPFDSLFLHLVDKHAQTLGDFRSLMREELHGGVPRVRWLDIEWPAKLPVLAEHHPANGRWNPDDDAPYQRYVAPEALTEVSIWEGRKVATEAGPPSTELVPNIIYAGELFRHTPLDDKIKTSIVLRYALDKRRAGREDPEFCPPMSEIESLPMALIQAGMYDLFNSCRCAACMGASGALARETNKVYTAGTLIHHFRNRHVLSMEWSKDMMVEPDWIAAAQMLYDSKMAGALAVFNQLFPLTEGANQSATLNGTENEGSPNITPVAVSPSADDRSHGPASTTTSVGFSSINSREPTPAGGNVQQEAIPEVGNNNNTSTSTSTATPTKAPAAKSPNATSGAGKSTYPWDEKTKFFGPHWQNMMKHYFSELVDEMELQALDRDDSPEEGDDEADSLFVRDDHAGQATGGGNSNSTGVIPSSTTTTTTSNSMQNGMDGTSGALILDDGHDHGEEQEQFDDDGSEVWQDIDDDDDEEEDGNAWIVIS